MNLEIKELFRIQQREKEIKHIKHSQAKQKIEKVTEETRKREREQGNIKKLIIKGFLANRSFSKEVATDIKQSFFKKSHPDTLQ